MQQLKNLWNELVVDDVDAVDKSEENAVWNSSDSFYHKIPHDVRLLIWVRRNGISVVWCVCVFFDKKKFPKGLCSRKDLLAARLTCRLVGLKDLHVRSRFWALWTASLLSRGAWASFSLPRTAAAGAGAGAAGGVSAASLSGGGLRSVLRFFAGAEEPSEQEQDASGFVAAMRNHRENERRVLPCSTAPANQEKVWNMKRSAAADKGVVEMFMNKLLSKEEYFVPIFGNALETTARKLVYRLMWGSGEEQPPLFPVTGVFPVKKKTKKQGSLSSNFQKNRVKVVWEVVSALQSEKREEISCLPRSIVGEQMVRWRFRMDFVRLAMPVLGYVLLPMMLLSQDLGSWKQ